MYMKILRAGVKLAHAHGFNRFTRSQLAAMARCADASVNYNFGSFTKLQDSIIVHAVASEDLQIIAQGIIAKHRDVQNIPDELRRRACNAI